MVYFWRGVSDYSRLSMFCVCCWLCGLGVCVAYGYV